MSEVKVNKLSPRSGTTVTLGDSGDTITIPSGVTLANSGTFTNFQSTGIDDNATSTAITINSSENVLVGDTSVTDASSSARVYSKTGYGIITNNNENAGGIKLSSSSTNSLIFQADPNNQRASTEMFFFVDGSEKMKITSGGDIGIGTSSPSEKLHVEGSGTTNAIIKSTGSSTASSVGAENNSGTVGKILMYGSSQGAFGSLGSGEMALYSDSAGMSIMNNNASGAIKFSLNSGTEKMRIDSSGNLLVGTTNNAPAQDNVTGVSLRPTDASEFSQDGENVLSLNRKSSSGAVQVFRKDGTEFGRISVRSDTDMVIGSSDAAITFKDSTDTIYPSNMIGEARDNAIDLGDTSTKFRNLYLGGGIYVGGTGTANKLDDYEEGLHTVTATDTGGGATITMNTSYDQLAYTKIGRVVHVQGILLFSSISGSFTGTLQISLPFTSSDLQDASGRTVLSLGTYVVDFTSGTAPYLNVPEGSSLAQVQVSRDNEATGQGRPQGSAQLYIGGSYITDA